MSKTQRQLEVDIRGKLDLVFSNFTTDKGFDKSFFEKVLRGGEKELGLEDKKLELSVILVGEGRIKSLNKKYRGKNKVTDVLSFPLNRVVEVPDSFRIRRRGRSRNFHHPVNERDSGKYDTMLLGDIFICLPVAKKESKRNQISLEKELARLTIHGFLHLLGHDHERSQKDAEGMFRIENKILQELGL